MADGRPDGLRSIETRPWRPERFVRDLLPDLFGDGEHRGLRRGFQRKLIAICQPPGNDRAFNHSDQRRLL